MPERAVKELMCGSPKEAYDSDTELCRKLNKFKGRSKQHPCIYAKTLTTADSIFKTVAQNQRLARWLQRYVDESPLTCQTDANSTVSRGG
jgi:hypothetical protein